MWKSLRFIDGRRSKLRVNCIVVICNRIICYLGYRGIILSSVLECERSRRWFEGVVCRRQGEGMKVFASEDIQRIQHMFHFVDLFFQQMLRK